jgi:type VI secretion system protein ImpA
LSPYNWLNEKLSERLKVIPITQKDDTVDSEDLTFADYIGLKNHWGSKTGGDSIPKDKEEAIKDFEKSIVLTPRAFFIRFKEQCVSLVEQSKNIEAFVTDQCNDNDDVPSLYRFRTVLEEMMTFAEQALKMKGDEETVSSEEAPLGETSLTLKESSEAAQTQEPLKNSQSLIKSREDAYQTIQQAADYLERLDPHSPVPPMIKRAIRWGKMPLKDVLQEVIKEPQALQEVKNLLGLSEGTE